VKGIGADRQKRNAHPFSIPTGAIDDPPVYNLSPDRGVSRQK
jgi:hypothetical protein